jgi:hypothetical protein
MMQQWNRGTVQFADQAEFEATLAEHVEQQFKKVVDPEVSVFGCCCSCAGERQRVPVSPRVPRPLPAAVACPAV